MDKTVALLLGLTVLAATGGLYLHMQHSASQDDYYRAQWSQWKSTFGRKYGAAEDEYRFRVFSGNLAAIDEHNEKFTSGQSSFELGLNHFGDLTVEEYEARYLTLQARPRSGAVFTGEGVVPNDAVDWVAKGAVTPIKNQGSCGSCWAFSATGAVEGLLFVRDGQKVSISEQELVDCAGGKYENEGCNGGLMDNAFHYIVDNGITTEDAYPYTGRGDTCKPNVQPRYHISGYTDVEVDKEAALVAALNQQPVRYPYHQQTLQRRHQRRLHLLPVLQKRCLQARLPQQAQPRCARCRLWH